MTLVAIYLVGLVSTALLLPLRAKTPPRELPQAVEAHLTSGKFWLLWPRHLWGLFSPVASAGWRLHKKTDRHFRIF